MPQDLLAKPELGLSAADVADRVARGQVNALGRGPSRTTADIVRANLLTRFNLILSVLLVVILFVAPIQDALFGIVMVVNAAIGIIQELRAKRTLDQLRLIEVPSATVLRDGQLVDVDVQQVVLDDVIEVRAGDQIVVDGSVLESAGLEIDESLLSGEADPIPKEPGDFCRSGSFVVAGIGRIMATAVGADAYAVRLATEARKFTLVKSELRAAIDVILAVVGWSLIPIGALLIWSQRDIDGGISAAARGAVAGMVAMIPQGLILLTSVAFAVAVVRLGQRRALVQELAAVEILARVDTVCLDKTGTLTQGKLRFIAAQPIDAADNQRDWAAAAGAIAWTDPTPNATMRALKTHYPDPGWPVKKRVPFSSARGWSGVRFKAHGTWLLGAPETVVPDRRELHAQARRLASLGQRVLLIAYESHGEPIPAAFLSLGDEMRPDAAATLRYFARQGVDVKVISGDHPDTVAAVASALGLGGPRGPVDASLLPEDEEDLRALVRQHQLFGRVTPHAKRRLVRSLQADGHTVAMTGDGVNDVLALKEADIGIAMGSGSPASRSVAQVVLLDNSFDALPHVVGEGRQIIANIERVANLFLTKTVYAVLLAFATAATQLAFPFLPRHLTLVGSLTIGIPAFFLALEPTASRARTGFLRRVWRFAVPTGILAAGASYLAYGLARSEGAGLEESRAVATLVLAAVGLFILTIPSRPLTTRRKALIASMAALFALVVLVPSLNSFYELPLPRPVVFFAAAGITALTGAFMWLALRAIGWFQEAAAIVADPPRRTAVQKQVRQGLNAATLTISRGRLGRRPPVVLPDPPRDEEAMTVDLRQEQQLELPLAAPDTSKEPS